MSDKIPDLYCQCGCREMIPKSERHRYPSKRPKYIHGHSHRNKFQLNRETIEQEYRNLGSGYAVAEKYGISPVAVYNMLKKIGVETLPKEILDDHNQRTGRQWEMFCLEKLEGSKDVSGVEWTALYDIEWKGFKINVKASYPTYSGKSKERLAWTFNTKKKDGTDIFLCLGLDENGELEKVFWIPAKDIKRVTTIRRNGNTKYEKYKTTFEQLNHERQENGY